MPVWCKGTRLAEGSSKSPCRAAASFHCYLSIKLWVALSLCAGLTLTGGLQTCLSPFLHACVLLVLDPRLWWPRPALCSMLRTAAFAPQKPAVVWSALSLQKELDLFCWHTGPALACFKNCEPGHCATTPGIVSRACTERKLSHNLTESLLVTLPRRRLISSDCCWEMRSAWICWPIWL